MVGIFVKPYINFSIKEISDFCGIFMASNLHESCISTIETPNFCLDFIPGIVMNAVFPQLKPLISVWISYQELS